MPKDILMHIGACIQKARKEKGWSRQEVYERTGISLRHIQDIEKGRTNCTCEMLYLLVKTLEIPGGYLFTPDGSRSDADCEQIVEAVSGCSEQERAMICRVVLDMARGFAQMKEKGES